MSAPTKSVPASEPTISDREALKRAETHLIRAEALFRALAGAEESELSDVDQLALAELGAEVCLDGWEAIHVRRSAWDAAQDEGGE